MTDHELPAPNPDPRPLPGRNLLGSSPGKPPSCAVRPGLLPTPVANSVSAAFRYVTCQIHNCSDKVLAAPFPWPIDRGSLTVQDDYIFLKVSSRGSPRNGAIWG